MKKKIARCINSLIQITLAFRTIIFYLILVMTKKIHMALAVTGASGIIAQIVFVREFVTIFYGNELLSGILLAVWLLGTAAGSGLVGRLAGRADKPFRLFTLLQIGIALLLPCTIIFARYSTSLWEIQQGVIVGLIPMVCIPLMVMAPLCVTLGFLYTLACRGTGGAVSNVYFFESLGAMLGGALASLVLIRLFTPTTILVIVSSSNVCSAALLYLEQRGGLRTGKQLVFALGIASLFALCLVSLSERIEAFSKKALWRGYDLVHDENTIYGNIAVTRNEQTFSFFENGLHSFTSPDAQTAEEVVHLPLLQHPDPHGVLLIGGGIAGRIEELLKTPGVERIDYVELDPGLIEAGRRFLSLEALEQRTVFLHHRDGRFRLY